MAICSSEQADYNTQRLLKLLQCLEEGMMRFFYQTQRLYAYSGDGFPHMNNM